MVKVVVDVSIVGFRGHLLLNHKVSRTTRAIGCASNRKPTDIMEGVEKEEEMILRIAMEFIQLFKRLRNIAMSITVSQMAQLMFTVLKLKDPDFLANCSRIVQMWMLLPWT